VQIRNATETDLPVLQDIERAAGRWFAEAGMPEIAEDEPPSADELTRYLREGHAWVAVDHEDVPAAYLIADRVDADLHVEQVSVHPRAARRGIGRSLLDHAAARAAGEGCQALTLTTFAEVPWNAPYYARCGFQVLAERDFSPAMRVTWEREAAYGLQRWPRVYMRRAVRAGQPPNPVIE
jgi:ribosomal protein S18 acetylase RimI-like enzyme